MNKLKLLLASVLGLIGGIAGTLSGQGYPKIIRRLGISSLIALVALITLKNPLALTILAMFLPLSMGYGIPDVNDPKGSFLGGLVYKLISKNQKTATAVTRGILGFIEGLCLVSIPMIKHNWGMYILISLIIILDNSLFSVILSNKKEIEIGKFKLLPSEVVIYSILVFASVVLIIL